MARASGRWDFSAFSQAGTDFSLALLNGMSRVVAGRPSPSGSAALVKQSTAFDIPAAFRGR